MYSAIQRHRRNMKEQNYTNHGMTGTSPGSSTNQYTATSIVKGDRTNPTKSASHQTIEKPKIVFVGGENGRKN